MFCFGAAVSLSALPGLVASADAGRRPWVFLNRAPGACGTAAPKARMRSRS